MNVAHLIELLSSMPEDAEVRMAHQPNYPMEYAIDEIVLVGGDSVRVIRKADYEAMTEDEQERANEDEDEGRAVFLDEGDDKPQPVVYIGEGGWIGYLPGVASKALSWR